MSVQLGRPFPACAVIAVGLVATPTGYGRLGGGTHRCLGHRSPPGSLTHPHHLHPRYSAAQRLVTFAELVDGPNLAVITASVDPPVLRLAE